jgi:hypothetical protein
MCISVFFPRPHFGGNAAFSCDASFGGHAAFGGSTAVGNFAAYTSVYLCLSLSLFGGNAAFSRDADFSGHAAFGGNAAFGDYGIQFRLVGVFCPSAVFIGSLSSCINVGSRLGATIAETPRRGCSRQEHQRLQDL